MLGYSSVITASTHVENGTIGLCDAAATSSVGVCSSVFVTLRVVVS